MHKISYSPEVWKKKMEKEAVTWDSSVLLVQTLTHMIKFSFLWKIM